MCRQPRPLRFLGVCRQCDWPHAARIRRTLIPPDSDDWRNAVLARLPGRPGPEPPTPWVHPPGDRAPVPGARREEPAPLASPILSLFDGDPEVRAHAATVLASSPSAEAIAALRAALHDPDEQVKDAVRAALKVIEGTGDLP